MDKFDCPICNIEHETLIRYYNCVCRRCLNTYGTRDASGNLINFGNIDAWGGIRAICNNKEIFNYNCYVNNVECYADEARFGGIVVRPINKSENK